MGACVAEELVDVAEYAPADCRRLELTQSREQRLQALLAVFLTGLLSSSLGLRRELDQREQV